MALAHCPACHRVLDIPGKTQSYRQPDGRCARCHETHPVKIPADIVQQFKPDPHPAPLPPPVRARSAARAAVKVEVGVPLVGKPVHGDGWGGVFPFDKLKAPKDDQLYSFLVPVDKPGARAAMQRRLAAGVNYYRKKTKTKAKFTVRQVEGGVRVWRVS